MPGLDNVFLVTDSIHHQRSGPQRGALFQTQAFLTSSDLTPAGSTLAKPAGGSDLA